MQSMQSNDSLSQFINNLSPKCEVFDQIKLQAPWGIEEQQLNRCSFSYLMAGNCVLEIENQKSISLLPGQLVLLPFGSPYKMMSNVGVKCQLATDLFSHKPTAIDSPIMTVGGSGKSCQLMCGSFSFSTIQHWGLYTLMGGLPEVIIVDAPKNSRLESLLLWIYQENSQRTSGYDLARKHLLELLLLELLRNVDKLTLNPGWLLALNDRHIAAVILAIQERFDENWSLETLAELAALSQSSFSARFKKMTGSAPLNFVRQWRCFVASQLLTSSQASIKQIAQRVGFQSSDVLIRNFRQFHQITPKQYRQIECR